jgi:hypothetical protein
VYLDDDLEGRGGGSQEAWRWQAGSSAWDGKPGSPTITVIEAPEKVEAERQERTGPTVPFGFGRELAPPAAPVEPQLWEGDGA